MLATIKRALMELTANSHIDDDERTTIEDVTNGSNWLWGFL